MHNSSNKVRKYTISIDKKNALNGIIECSGAKNVAIKAMIIALLTSEITILHNIPYIGDVDTTILLLESLNVKVTKKEYNTHQTLIIDPSNKTNISNLNISNRASISLLGILSHFSQEFSQNTCLPNMDGCKLGSRDINFHLNIYKQFGLEINSEHNLELIKPFKGRIQGQIIKLPYPSIGATETALFLAVLAEGKTIIDNIATEPEVMEVITMLQMMGAEIIFTNKRTVEIYGVKSLKGVEFEIMPDRLEIVSWAVLAAISDGNITVKHTRLSYLHTFLGYFQHIGGGTKYIDSSTLTFYKAKEKLCIANISTAIYPSLATDQLAQLSIMLGLANGISTLHETVYENRVNVISDMFKAFGIICTPYTICLGQECRFSGHNFTHSLAIHGTDKQIIAPDKPIILPKNIRCAHSYLLLATQALGTTILLDPSDSIHRGYGAKEIVDKLQQIGLNITQELVEYE